MPRLVAVVCVFLLVEFPLAVLFIIYIAENMAKTVLIDLQTASVASLFVNFFILLSYPVNFFIYCGMSRQFRETFRRLFSRASSGRFSGATNTEVTSIGPGGGTGAKVSYSYAILSTFKITIEF